MQNIFLNLDELNVHKNDMGVNYINKKEITMIFENCIKPMIKNGKVKPEHFSSMILGLVTIDELLTANKDYKSFIRNDREALIRKKIELLTQEKQIYKNHVTELSLLYDDPKASVNSKVSIVSQKKFFFKAVYDIEDKIETLKVSLNYPSSQVMENVSGARDIVFGKSTQQMYIKSTINILNNLGMTVGHPRVQGYETVLQNIFEEGLLDE